MATYMIPAPESMCMSGDLSTNWKVFKQSWDYFNIATELNKKTETVQAAALCSIMGKECVI